MQKPLVRPALIERDEEHQRGPGETFAIPKFKTPIDSRSTDKLELLASWNEPHDDPEETGPVNRTFSIRAWERKVRRDEAPGTEAEPGWLMFGRHGSDDPEVISSEHLRHEFGDTRYRRVQYQLEATSRFREYMPPAIQKDPDALKVVSEQKEIHVYSSAAPPAPEVLYVIPTFKWERDLTEPNTILAVGQTAESRRFGGGLRVYLKRPWYVTGYGEHLAVVLPASGTSNTSIEGPLKPYVTQWGIDPIWSQDRTTTPSPAPEDFSLTLFGRDLDDDELARMGVFMPEGEKSYLKDGYSLSHRPLSQAPGLFVELVPHLVCYDPDRQLWYSDIEINPGEVYYPFIRLALARFQARCAEGKRLSPIVQTEVTQLAPRRCARVSASSSVSYYVELSGPGGRPANRQVRASVQTRPGGADDLAWEPFKQVRCTSRTAPGDPATLWHGDVLLTGALPLGTEARILIEELELYPDSQQRLVFAETIRIR